MKKKILIIEDKKSLLEMLMSVMEEEGFDVEGTSTIDGARKKIQNYKFDFILSDLKLPDGESIDLLEGNVINANTIPFLIMTGYGTIKKAVKAMKYGAVDFIEKPVDIDELVDKINELTETKEDEMDTSVHKEYLSNGNILLYSSNLMKQILIKARKIAKLPISVLITGESGTGKELIARYIHDFSGKDKKKYIAINCAAIPRDLMESELFGAEKGAFTNSIKRIVGKFELAHNGTLVLDEIGDLNIDLQGKLLRVLDEGKFRRIGGTDLVEVNVRIIALTNKDLFLMQDAGNFRNDLYYRLSQFMLHIPPLRERKEDIEVLLNYYLKYFSKEYGMDEIHISKETKNILLNYEWYGNVREVKNFISQALLNLNSNEIDNEFAKKYIDRMKKNRKK